jgi:hypothetical protein
MHLGELEPCSFKALCPSALENLSFAPRALLLQSALANLSLALLKRNISLGELEPCSFKALCPSALENLSFAPRALLLQSALENLSLALLKRNISLGELELCSGTLAPSKRHLRWPEQLY